MKKHKWFTTRAFLCSLFLLWIQAPAGAAVLLSFDPQQGQQRVGDTLFVNLNADITGGDSIVSFGLDVNFNPAIVEAIDAHLNAAIFPEPQIPPDLKLDGKVTLVGFVPFSNPPVSGSVTLATLEFLIKQFGSTPLTISFTGPTQGFGLPFPPGGILIPGSGDVKAATISAVPEPTTLALIGPAFALWTLTYKPGKTRKLWKNRIRRI